jgi:uncharacterized protein
MNPTLSPVSSGERINSLDVMRGIALFGILLMNIVGFGMIFKAYGDPSVMGGADGWNLRVWVINNMFFEGTMRAMFSMLFGVGMVVMTTRMEERGGGIEVADIYYRRTLWLLLFGVIHAYLILWAGEVLFPYGLFGMFLFPFRKVAPVKLIAFSVVLILIGFGLTLYSYNKQMGNLGKFEKAATYKAGETIPDDIKEGKEAWQETLKTGKPDEKAKQKAVTAMHQGYFGLVMHLAPINRMVQTVFNYDYNPWDVLPMMLLGIALYRLKIITAELSYRTYLIMVITGYAIGLSINYYEVTTIIDGQFSIPAFLKSGITYPFGRIAMAIGHIGLIMIFCKANFLVFLKRALAAVGRMALTNYITHSVVCSIIFTGIGFSLYGQLQRYQLYYVVFSIWLFQLIVSPIWLTYFHFGPLEWMWRSLTYQKLQPFRKQTEPEVLAGQLAN